MLTAATVRRLKYALANNDSGQEVADAIDEATEATTELPLGNVNVGDADGNPVATPLAKVAIGKNASYLRTATGAQTLLAAADVDRIVVGNIHVDTVFANGDGGQPTFSVGYTGHTADFSPTAALTGAAAGATKSFSGLLPANNALLVTAVAASGTTSTGAITVCAIVATVAP